MNPECDSDPSLVDILEREVIGKILIRSCFTEEEWDRLSENQITRCEQQYLKYINSVSLRKEHTLKEFIRQTEPAPEISQPEGNISVEPTQLQDDIISPVHSVISWSNSDPDKITSSQNRSWSSKTNSSSDEIYGETPRRSRKLRRPRTPRKLTLEEQWDASDKEHELEKAAKRAAEAALSKKADNKKGPGKTRKRKYRKKRGISLKVTQSVPERTKSGTVTRSQTALKKSNTKTKIVERESSTSSSSLDVSAVKRPRASKSSKSYNTQKKVIQKEYLTVASSRLLRSRTVRSGPPQPTVKHSLSSPRPNKNSVSPNTEHKRFLPYVGLSTSTSQQNFNGPGPSPVSSSRSKHLLSPSTENQRSLPYYGPFSSTHKQKLEDQVGPRSLSSRSKYSSPCAENPRSLSYYGPATSTYQQNFGGLGPSSVSSRSKHLSPSAEHPRSLPYYGPSTNTYQQNVEGFGPSPLPSTQSKILFSSNEHRRSLPYHAPSTTTYRQNFKGPGPIPTSSTHSKILTSSAEHQRSLPYVGPSISPYRQHFVGPRPSTLSSPRGQISSSSTENHTSLPYYGPSTNTYQQNVEGFGPIPLSSTHSKILSSSAEQQRSLPYVGPSISTYRQHLEGPRPSTLSSPRGQISSSSTENYTSLPNYGPSTNTYQQNFGGLKPSSLSTWSKHSSPSAEHPRSLSYYGSSTGTDQQKFDISGPSPFSYLQSKLLHPTTEQQRSLPYYEPSTRTDQQKFDTPRPTSFNMHHEWCGCEKKTFKPSYRSIVPALLKKNKPNLPSSNQICGKEKVPVSKQGVATSETGQALNTTISDVPIRNYSSTPRIRQGQTEAASNQICMKERVPVSEQGVASSATGQALNTTISEHAPLKKKDSSTTKIRQEPTKTALNQMCVKKKVPVPEQGVASSETGQALNTTISEHAPIRNYSLTPRIRQGPTKAASNQICIKERVAVSEQGVASSETGRALNTTISEHVPIKQDLSTTKIRKEPTETGTALNQMCVKEKVPVPEQGVASSETGRALNTTISEHVPIKQDLSTTKIRKEPTETALNQMCVKEKVPVPEQGVASSETGQALNTTISEHVPIRNYSSTSRIRQAPTEAASNQICMKQRVPVSEQGVASSATGQALNTIISEHVPLKTKDSSTTKIRQESTKTALNQMCVKEKVPVPEQGVASSETGQALNTTISEHAPIRSYSLTPRIRQGPTKAASNQIGMKGRVPVSEQNVASSETGRALSTTISEHVPIKQDLSTTKIRQEPTKTALNQMCVKEKVPVPEQGVASSETGQALNSTISKHLPIKKTNLTTRIRQGPKKAACSKRLFQNVIKHGNTLTVKPPPALRLANIGRVNTQPAKRVQSSVTKEEPGQKAAISASPCTVVCQAQASTSGTQSKPETTNVLRPSQTSAKSSETPRKEIQVGNRRFNVLKHGVYDIVRQAIFSVNEMANRPIPNHSSADNVVSRTNDNTATPRRYSKDEMLAAQVLANDLPFHVLQIVHIEVEIPTPEAETSVATTSGRLESNASEGLESSTSEGIECIADGNNGLPGNLHVEATTSSLVATTAVATTSGGLESSASEGLGCSTSEGLECIADSDNDLPSNVHVAATTSSTTAVATNSGGLESFADSHNDMETLASLQSTANRSGSRLTRTGSGEASRPLRTSEIYSSFDTLYPLSSKTKFSQKQSFSFDSYWKKPSTQKSFLDEEAASNRVLETCYTPRYNTRKKSDHDDNKWSYKEFRFPSPPLAHKLPDSAFSASRDFQFSRYKPANIRDRTDYLSLSLSPPGSRSESVFLRDCPSLSPSKDVSLLDLEDIKKLRYIENRESQEDETEYEAGGYMPINIGDVLRNQYKVCRKLGWGHFSTVWLCKNLYESGPRYVALKICKSAPMFTAVANDEIRLLQETRSVNPNHAGYRNIVQMVDTFKLISENGVHTAISLEIMGPSLLHLLMQSDFRGIQVPAVRRIIFQVLRGLTYLHEECHIIHTDIKPENILIKVDENYIRRIIGKMERFSELGVELPRSYVSSEFWTEKDSTLHESDDDIISRFGEQRASSYPNDIYLSELVNYRERHSQTNFNAPMWVNPNIEIKIADLGNACWVDHHFSQEIQTRQYRALEVIMGAGYSYPADIWSVGCMAFELATGEMLFSPKGSSDLSANIDHLCLIWETLGGIPRYITETGSESKKFFVNGHLKDVPMDNLRIWKIEDVLVEKYKWKRLDAIPFAGFLESLVEPDPALRATASQALTNEWLLSTDI